MRKVEEAAFASAGSEPGCGAPGAARIYQQPHCAADNRQRCR